MSIRPSDTTFSHPLRVVLTAKNQQGLSRLAYDVHPLLAEDPRLHLRFSVVPGSHFERQAHRFLYDRGEEETPWRKIRAFKPNLIISASPSKELFKARAPFMVLAHGAGNNRLRTDLRGVYGLSPDQLLDSGTWWPKRCRPIPDWLPLAGPAALAQLKRDCPQALPVAEVVGDLCHERMVLSSNKSKREEYRKALGIKPHHVFVVICSTWGHQSLVGRDQHFLPRQLLTSLPMSQYRLGIIPHPNIENGDGPSLKGILAPELANGLMMPPPHEGWRAMIIAADLIIGDSGSVTQYAAAIGKPVLLRAFGREQMPSDSALARFGDTLEWLDLTKPLEPQLTAAVESRKQGSEAFDFSLILARDRSPSERLIAKSYDLLGIPPTSPVMMPLLLPRPESVPQCRPTSAWNFSIRFSAKGAQWRELPVSLPQQMNGTVVARSECMDRRLLARADVLLHHHETVSIDEARETLEALLEDWPHCKVASVRIGPKELLVATARHGHHLVRVYCPDPLIDVIPPALEEWLTQLSPDSTCLNAAHPFIGLERQFETSLSILPL